MLTLKEAVRYEHLLSQCFADVTIDGTNESPIVLARGHNQWPLSSPGCKHERTLRMTEVTATIKDGHLSSGQFPILYDVIEYCGNHSCELVFKAEKFTIH